MKTKEEIEHLRSKMAAFEKEDREKWVNLKNEMEESREKLCVSLGGHFYCEPMKKFVEMFIGYIDYTLQVCEVCRKEKILKEDRHQDDMLEG